MELTKVQKEIIDLINTDYVTYQGVWTDTFAKALDLLGLQYTQQSDISNYADPAYWADSKEWETIFETFSAKHRFWGTMNDELRKNWEEFDKIILEKYGLKESSIPEIRSTRFKIIKPRGQELLDNKLDWALLDGLAQQLSMVLGQNIHGEVQISSPMNEWTNEYTTIYYTFRHDYGS